MFVVGLYVISTIAEVSHGMAWEEEKIEVGNVTPGKSPRIKSEVTINLDK